MSCGCCCEDTLKEFGEFPSPLSVQIHIPNFAKNIFGASGYDLCIEDVMLTIQRGLLQGFPVTESM